MRLKLADWTKAKPPLVSSPAAQAAAAAAFDDFIVPFSRTVRISGSGSSSRQRKSTTRPAASVAASVAMPQPDDSAGTTRPAPTDAATATATVGEYRENDMHIQMLSRSLYHQVFGARAQPAALPAATAERFRQRLRAHGIEPGAGGGDARLPDIGAERLRLPPLRAGTLVEHFERCATEQSLPYRRLADRLAAGGVPAMPARWALRPGWTQYCGRTGEAMAVPFPADAALVFDVENCVKVSGGG